jgi:predicted patatin/cPLA2 family phospholipase
MPNLYDELTAHKQNSDEKVFGLVVQGGGMRATYSAGALVTLVEYGFSDAFDHVIGSSAGAMNAAYFISADKSAAHIYTDDLSNKNFVDLLRSDKKVDVDYVVDLVLKHKRPINIEKLLKARSQLHIVVTNAQTGRKEVISDHHKFADIYEEFRATAALPLLYDKKIAIGDKWYIDGGVSDLIPVDIAIKLGCTDIVVIMTQQVSSYHFDKQHTRLINHLIRRFASKQTAAVRKILPTNEQALRVNLRRLTHPLKKTRIYLLEPSDEDMLFSLLTINKVKVAALAELGVKDMDTFLQKPIST